MTLDPQLISEYRNSIVAYARALSEQDDNPFHEIWNTGYNLNTIKETFIQKFADNLKLSGVDSWGSKRIAKEQAQDIMDDVLAEIN